MAIEFRCPACGKAYRVAEQLAGKTAKCKSCDAAMTIPEVDREPDLAAVSHLEHVAAAPAPVSSRAGGANFAVWGNQPFLNDDLARMVSGILLLALLGVCFWFARTLSH